MSPSYTLGNFHLSSSPESKLASAINRSQLNETSDVNKTLFGRLVKF
jgi:hypothetical protein